MKGNNQDLRFRILSRRDGLPLVRKAGSSRGACAKDVRDDLFLSLRGEGGCVGVTTAGGDVVSSSLMDFSLLKRDNSEKDKTLRSGGAIGVSLLAVGVSSASSLSFAWHFISSVVETVSHIKTVESAATVTSCMRESLSPANGTETKAASVMPSVCPQSRAMRNPYSEYSRTDLSPLETPMIVGFPLSDGVYLEETHWLVGP